MTNHETYSHRAPCQFEFLNFYTKHHSRVNFSQFDFIVISGSFSEFIVSPNNLAVTRGDKAILNCSKFINTSIPLRWRRLDTGDDPASIISSGGRLMPDFTNGSYTVDAPGNHTANLIIDPVDMTHAGRYQCSDGMKGSEDQNNSRTAELIVLGELFHCWTIIILTIIISFKYQRN